MEFDKADGITDWLRSTVTNLIGFDQRDLKSIPEFEHRQALVSRLET